MRDSRRARAPDPNVRGRTVRRDARRARRRRAGGAPRGARAAQGDAARQPARHAAQTRTPHRAADHSHGRRGRALLMHAPTVQSTTQT